MRKFQWPTWRRPDWTATILQVRQSNCSVENSKTVPKTLSGSILHPEEVTVRCGPNAIVFRTTLKHPDQTATITVRQFHLSTDVADSIYTEAIVQALGLGGAGISTTVAEADFRNCVLSPLAVLLPPIPSDLILSPIGTKKTHITNAELNRIKPTYPTSNRLSERHHHPLIANPGQLWRAFARHLDQLRREGRPAEACLEFVGRGKYCATKRCRFLYMHSNYATSSTQKVLKFTKKPRERLQSIGAPRNRPSICSFEMSVALARTSLHPRADRRTLHVIPFRERVKLKRVSECYATNHPGCILTVRSTYSDCYRLSSAPVLPQELEASRWCCMAGTSFGDADEQTAYSSDFFIFMIRSWQFEWFMKLASITLLQRLYQA
ncbi:hypothetical protein C8J56DRAFT_879867 [Mycena floridula]|nr:hypothetical protein C8J56DRAFT_879867 [Mycena floridula]